VLQLRNRTSLFLQGNRVECGGNRPLFEVEDAEVRQEITANYVNHYVCPSFLSSYQAWFDLVGLIDLRTKRNETSLLSMRTFFVDCITQGPGLNGSSRAVHAISSASPGRARLAELPLPFHLADWMHHVTDRFEAEIRRDDQTKRFIRHVQRPPIRTRTTDVHRFLAVSCAVSSRRRSSALQPSSTLIAHRDFIRFLRRCRLLRTAT